MKKKIGITGAALQSVADFNLDVGRLGYLVAIVATKEGSRGSTAPSPWLAGY